MQHLSDSMFITAEKANTSSSVSNVMWRNVPATPTSSLFPMQEPALKI